MKMRIAAMMSALLVSTTAWAGTPPPAPVPPAPVARAVADMPISPNQIDRLTDAVVTALPLGKVFEQVAARDPAWPAQDRPEAVDAAQLACLRGELSEAGYHRTKHADVEVYAAAHPSRFGSDLALMEGGTARLLGALVMAGANAQNGQGPADPKDVMRDASPEAMLGFTRFISDPDYSDLRKLSGIGDVFDFSRSESENQAAGKRMGASLAMQAMVRAMGTCHVSPSAFL